MLSILIRTKSNIDQKLFCGTDSVRTLIVPAIELDLLDTNPLMHSYEMAIIFIYSIEVIRLGQSLWINWDASMYYEIKDTPALARYASFTFKHIRCSTHQCLRCICLYISVTHSIVWLT